MNTTWIIVTTCTLLAANSAERGAQRALVDPEQDLVARIKGVTGAEPVECGRLIKPYDFSRPTYRVEEIAEPIRCSTEAARRHREFYFVIKTFGFDSWTATGLLGSADGIVKVFTYDNYAGQGVLRTKACESPTAKATEEGHGYLACS